MGDFNGCNNSRLLFTGTDDSLMYKIKTEDISEDFSNDKEMLGFSNYWLSQNATMIWTN